MGSQETREAAGWLGREVTGLYESSGYGEGAERRELRSIQAAEAGKGQKLLR